MSSEVNLRPLSGFKMDFSANPDFDKFFFAASCDCGTSALLSLEVSIHKTDDEINKAMLTLERAKKQKENQRNMDLVNYYQST